MAYRECPHTGGVLCDAQVRCSVCGWNPAVAEYRKSKLQAPKKPKEKKKSRPSGANTGSGNLRAHNYKHTSR